MSLRSKKVEREPIKTSRIAANGVSRKVGLSDHMILPDKFSPLPSHGLWE